MAASPSVVDDIQTRDRWGAVDDQGIDDMGPVKLDHDTVMDDLPTAIAAEDPSTFVNGNGEDISTSTLKPRDDATRDRPPKVLNNSLVLPFRLSCVSLSSLVVASHLLLLGHSSLPHGWMLDVYVPVDLTVTRLGRHAHEPSTSTAGLPNKVYIGGLPENTRPEDLRNGFGKLGKIVNIELKTGYGFVEFDNRQSAEESVAKYHEGYFMGNKVRVEIAHGKGRGTKRTEDPGACFKCGENGHWAKCARSKHHRCELTHGRFDRECSRQTTHSRYPPPRSSHEYDDCRTRGPPSSRYDRSGYDRDSYSSMNPPAPRDYDRYDRRLANDRYEPPGGRPRTPPGPPPSRRDHYDRPSRGFEPPERVERGRPTTPPRSVDYARSRSLETVRYRWVDV
ncbi:hypothetical protein BKA82DRAFT_23949 [Pisolithus tinctorius]|nr:hypothetical protein BKA82DRAFT_23949 [Pisolithus tinctorius]